VPGAPSPSRGDEIVRSPGESRGARVNGGQQRLVYDTLIRTGGLTTGTLQDTTALFTSNGARSNATTNLINGSTLPSDQSHVVLALRVFTWYRNPILRIAGSAGNEVALNGDYGSLAPFLVGGASVGNAPATIQDVYRLHWQTEEQLQSGALAA